MLALDELHGEAPLLACREKLIERDEVGMRQIGEGAELLLEAIEVGGGVVKEGLEGDHRVARLVARQVDDAHAAGAEQTDDVDIGKPGGSQRYRAARRGRLLSVPAPRR